MTRFLQQLFGFQVTETKGERLFFYAFELFVAACTLKYAWTWAAHLQQLGDVVLPLGLANYVDVSVLFQSWVAYGVAALLTGTVALGALRWWRYGYLAALLLLHLLFAARYSQGEIPHSSNVLGMTLLGLSLAVPAFDTEKLRRRFAIGFAYFSVGIGYTSAAVCKLVASGPQWVDGRHLQLWIHEKSIDVFAASGTFDFTLLQSLALDHYWIATLFLVIGLVSESLAISMCWPRFRVPAVLAVLGLHAGIYLTMRIIFAITTLELILLALPWACLVTRVLGASAATVERECPLPHLRPAPSSSRDEVPVSAPSAAS
ncbi:MAG: hypothetical protein R6T83_09355 [Salinibacter sp.]